MLRTVDWRVQVAAITAMTVIVVAVIVSLILSKDKEISSMLPLVIALLAVPTITGLVSMFKADEASRKLDKIDAQTNGGLSDNVEAAVRQALDKILAANEADAKRDRRHGD